MLAPLLACALTIAASNPALAQRSPGSFSLPTPTPTPTTAPQGPVDERAGVPIGPRIIRQPTPIPTPPPTPAPTPTQAPTRAPSATTPTPTSTSAPPRVRSTPAPSPTAGSTVNPAPTTRATSEPTGPVLRPTRRITRSPLPPPDQTTVPEPEIGASEAQGPSIPIEDDIGPGFEAFPDGVEDNDPIGPDEWYDIDEVDAAGSSDTEIAADERRDAEDAWDNTRNRIIAGIAVLLLLLAGVAAMIWRRRRREAAVQGEPSSALTSGIRKSMAGEMPEAPQDAPERAEPDRAKDERQDEGEEPAEPEPKDEPQIEPELPEEVIAAVEPEPQPDPTPPAPIAPNAIVPAKPARIDLDLTIESATRSFMMFTVEFSLEVANRSGHAVRELTLAAKLDSARRGASNAAPIAGGQPIGAISRIGPQQSQRVRATLQLPLSEVTPIRQGSTPLLIPLLHVTLEGNGQSVMNRSFVLGTPSQAGTGRVHPLPLDAAPGGLPPLHAQAIKQPGEDDAQSKEPV